MTATVHRHRSYINLLMLLRVIGWLLMIEAAFMVIPCVVGLFYGERSFWQFLICIGVTAGCGGGLMSIRPLSREMGKREAICLTGFTWIILSIFGMLPFLICQTHLNITDAFFETMSGFTTTGATVLNSLSDVPKSILLWRCIVQWIGGLGIILFTLAVLPMLNYQGGMQLFNAEVTGITHDKLRPRVSATAKGLWLVYIVLTAMLVVLLAFSDMDFFNALCYAMSTMSTGGFSTSDDGIALYNTLYVKVVMVVFMFLGGVNLSLIYNAVSGKVMNIFRNTVFKAYLCFVLAGYLLISADVLLEGLYEDVSDVTIDPLFQTVSMLSSTGIAAPGFNSWGPLAVVVILVLMFVGACAGSTSGGAKIDRFIVLFKFIKNEFYKIMHPSSVTTVILNGRGTNPAIIHKTLAFLFLYIIVIVVGGTVISLFGIPLADGVFCALQAVSNMGMGTDTTGLNGDYSLMPDAVKWLLSFLMLVGRLEIFTVILVFTPGFWKR